MALKADVVWHDYDSIGKLCRCNRRVTTGEVGHEYEHFRCPKNFEFLFYALLIILILAFSPRFFAEFAFRFLIYFIIHL